MRFVHLNNGIYSKCGIGNGNSLPHLGPSLLHTGLEFRHFIIGILKLLVALPCATDVTQKTSNFVYNLTHLFDIPSWFFFLPWGVKIRIIKNIDKTKQNMPYL